MERAGAARCFSEAGRHCWEAAATTTAAVTGTAPGVSIGDTGPCGTGSAGPVRWEGRVTSREGGLRRRRWCEAPFLLRAGSSNCGRTRGPRKRTTSRGRRSTAAGTRNGLLPGCPVLARDPGPLRRPVPSRHPFRPRPHAAGSAVLRSPLPQQPEWALPPRIPSSQSQSALPRTVILLAPAPGWGLGAVLLLSPCVLGPSPTLLILILAQVSSCYLLSPIRPLPHPHQPGAPCF